MIDITISGSLPVVNSDFTEAFETIADIMFRSVQENFIVGGRPNQWPALKEFGLAGSVASHLYKSGFMFENIQLAYDSQHAKVSIDTTRVPYAAIHNFGGTIKHPGSDKFQVFPYNGGMIFTHGTKPHDINIPQRQFMMFQDEDREQILQTLSNAIFTETIPS